MNKKKYTQRRIATEIADHLTPIEAYSYFCLATKSDLNTLESHAKQKTIADLVNKSERTTRRYIKKMEGAELISKITQRKYGCKGFFNRNTYSLKDEKWIRISLKLLDESIPACLKGFLILFKTKCLNYSNISYYTGRQLAEHLVIGKSSVCNFIKQAKELGYIKEGKDKEEGKYLKLTRDDLFIIEKETVANMIYRLYPGPLDDDDIYEIKKQQEYKKQYYKKMKGTA